MKQMCDDSTADVAGFNGFVEHSRNGEYRVLYCDGGYFSLKWQSGAIALLQGTTLLFKKKMQRPDDCHVSDDGIVICCDLLNTNALAGKFLIFDKTGQQIFAKKTTAILGECAISSDSEIAIFQTFSSDTDDSNQIFIIDIAHKKVIHKFPRPHSFNTAEIDTVNKLIKLKDHRGFVFEIDFDGHQTNCAEYENQVLRDGSVYDKLWLYKNKPNVIKLRDERYLNLLIQALADKNASYGFGQDRLYREIGEYYEVTGNITKTIENWEKALAINPRVGVKRKLDNLKKRKTVLTK